MKIRISKHIAFGGLTCDFRQITFPEDSKSSEYELLLQEEYGEHHSAISYCKFSMSGQYISSLDVDGIVK